MSLYTLSQILVCLAIISDAISFQFKRRNRILICLFVSVTLTAIHFFMLGHSTAGLLMMLSAIRYLVGLFRNSKRTMEVFLVLTLAATALTYEGMLSLMSCAGSLLHTTAVFCNTDKKLRLVMMAGTVVWIVHNVLAGSPGAVLLESLFLCSNLAGYYRYYIRRKHPLEQS
ncbi:inner membrane protein [Paucidesulfovibrio gracilis DSM 16080]|uniref:Inner membrane protein n=1 Tax=Paucidesulfovibrio gracilis DSM 16080 TaxID=1121449 RepID=A0A1T4W643_9BACT|nr:YgjV family protein [Paucidesulfovibrio gracilis]SKA72505.1 inner membrane protein [Paucidesulfovibrio gracilis DSM 16080]